MFCMQLLNDGSEIEALLCGHAFHHECLQRFVDVTGKQRTEACPAKCHQSQNLQVIPDAEPAEVEAEDPEGEESEGRDSEGDEAVRRIS